jgi:tRNA-modifying protein YgfZ
MTDPSPLGSRVPLGAVALTHHAVIRVRGADAASFLQGQLTNDFGTLGLSQARLAAWCSAKGRMLASFVGFKRSHEEIWLATRADVLPATVKRLRMFVLRAKAQLDDGEGGVALVGLVGSSAAEWLEAALPDAAVMPVWTQGRAVDASVIRLPDAAGQPRWLWAGDAAQSGSVLGALPSISLSAWDWLEVHSGIAPIVAATSEAFVPQMLNYELVGGVDFKKGCYPGQEIVARSQYRGTLKRRTALLHGETPMQAGQEVWWSGDAGQPSGLVAVAAPAPDGGHDALVEVKLAALDDGSLHLSSVDGPALGVLPLPYAVPRENQLT